MARAAESLQTEIVVVGAGLVGIAAAIALAEDGWQVSLVDSRASVVPGVTEGWDQRIYAITPGNKRWLADLGVWENLDASRICDVERMLVRGDDGDSSLTFDAYEASLPSLSFILEGNRLQQALWSRAQALDIRMIETDVAAVSLSSQAAKLTCTDGRLIEASLVVAADGGNSTVRRLAGLSTVQHAYEEQGLVANFECELPHGQAARQWFRTDGVLAWLPLPGRHISIVWSTGRNAELNAMDEATLCQTVAEAGSNELGALKLLGKPATFPLNLQMSDRLVQPGLVLVGDAAHQVHPLAGQGVNLGFRDVICLSEVLRGRRTLESPGDIQLLRRYERARKPDILAMRHLTHGLHALFLQPRPLVRRLRNLGLDLTNRLGGLKNRLIHHATI